MCMIENADNYVSVSHAYQVKSSRKEHRCNECGRTIAKGEGYHRAELCMEGGWYTFHTCVHCRVACAWLSEQCGGYLHEGVLEDVMEHAAVYHLGRLTRLEVGMKRKWKRFDGYGLMPVPQVPRVVEKDRHA